MHKSIGVDLGTSGVKTTDEHGDHYRSSQLSQHTRALVNRAAVEDGPKTRRVNPLRIAFEDHVYHVGDSAHAIGKPVVLSDSTERLKLSPQIKALLYAAMTPAGLEYDTANIAVGLPLSVVTGETAVAEKEAIRKWMKGTHYWTADGAQCKIEITDVALPTQASVALLHYLKAKGINRTKGMRFASASIGAGTVEIEVYEYAGVGRLDLVPALSASFELGIKTLVAQMGEAKGFTFGEMDQRLRTGMVKPDKYVPGWWSEIAQAIAGIWMPDLIETLEFVLVMGGGSLLLGTDLQNKFNGKLRLPDDPLHAVSRGLFAYAIQKANAVS